MGRPRKDRTTGTGDGEVARPLGEEAASPPPPFPSSGDGDGPVLELVPDRLIEGRPNIEHFRVRLRNLNALNEFNQFRKGQLLKGYKQTLDGILLEAKFCEFKERDILSAIGVEDRIQALLERVLDEPTVNHALEADDAVLDRMEEGIQAAIDGCKARLVELRAEGEREGAKYRARIHAGKAWMARLRRLRRVRSDVRETRPAHRCNGDIQALDASLVLRRMLYIMRSDISESSQAGQKIGRERRVAPADLILEIPRHVCDFAVAAWVAQNGVKFYAAGSAGEVRAAPHIFTEDGGGKKGCYECEGLIIVAPPRHMKTTFGAAWTVTEEIENPRLQCFLLHAVEELAQNNYNLVRNCFHADDAAGKRTQSLFPDVRLRRSTDTHTWFDVSEKTKNAQLSFAGIRQGKLGTNVDRLWTDDPVERAEVTAEHQRERTHKQFTQVYLPRVQGRSPFTIITATLWHDDDTVSRLIRQAEAGKVKFAVIIRAAGGPKSSPPFKPLWESRYPARWLRSKYETMQDPHGYACQFMAQTKTDELRTVRRLGLYLARVDHDAGSAFRDCSDNGGDGACGKCHGCLMRAHRKFLAGAEFHLSLDPSATSKREVKRHTDRAGLVYGACGDVVREFIDSGMIVHERRTELRIADAKSFFASGTEAIEEIKHYSTSHRVDVLHIETVTFSSMIVESVRNQFNLDARQVVGHPPKNLSKAQRLQSIALLLDDSPRDVGLAGASILFPGVLRADGSITIDESLKWVERQIVDFGSTGEDHVVDAITQLGKHVAHQLQHGRGAISEAMGRAVDAGGPAPKSMRERMMDEYAREEPDDNVYDQETRFIMASSGAWRG